MVFITMYSIRHMKMFEQNISVSFNYFLRLLCVISRLVQRIDRQCHIRYFVVSCKISSRSILVDDVFAYDNQCQLLSSVGTGAKLACTYHFVSVTGELPWQCGSLPRLGAWPILRIFLDLVSVAVRGAHSRPHTTQTHPRQLFKCGSLWPCPQRCEVRLCYLGFHSTLLFTSWSPKYSLVLLRLGELGFSYLLVSS